MISSFCSPWTCTDLTPFTPIWDLWKINEWNERVTWSKQENRVTTILSWQGSGSVKDFFRIHTCIRGALLLFLTSFFFNFNQINHHSAPKASPSDLAYSGKVVENSPWGIIAELRSSMCVNHQPARCEPNWTFAEGMKRWSRQGKWTQHGRHRQLISSQWKEKR